MHPVLFSFSFFTLFTCTLYTYGLCVAVGALCGLWYFASQQKKSINLPKKQVYDLIFYGMLGSLVGGRLLYVVLNWKTFPTIIDTIKVWEGGLVYFGGFIGGLAVFLICLKRWRIDYMKALDVASPAVALTHAIGRIGCFFAGCCYGKESTVPWGVVFKDPQSLAPTGVMLHPTQLYESIGNMSIFIWLHLSLRNTHKSGTIFYRYLIGYGIVRYAVEFFRNDPRGPVWYHLTIMQYGALIMIALGIALSFKKGIGMKRPGDL